MLDTGVEATQSHAEITQQSAPTSERTIRLRRWAAGLGLLGTLLALVVPFLPVRYDQVDLRWPTAQGTRPVAAALTGYQPNALDATVPCTTMRSLGTGVVFSTLPTNSSYFTSAGLSVTLTGGHVAVTNQGTQLTSVPVPPGDCALTVHSNGVSTSVALDGNPLIVKTGDIRAQVTGIYSDLNAAHNDVRGLSVDIQPDTRYQTTATVLKVVVMILASLAFIGAMIALHRLDWQVTGHRLRILPRRWWKPSVLDAAVFVVLIVWWLIGSGTSDDGYILTMARDEAANGYIGNIFRWFNTPEAPFGWFYEVYARWVRVSTLTPWTRLPALLMGLTSWFLISREALPRLGNAVRRSRAASWAAAGAFLAFWLPYDNGLRPETVVVVWTLLSMVLVERTIATRRLFPAAIALFAAAFAIAATPTGLMSLAPLLASSRSLLVMLRDRGRQLGWTTALAPLTAAGTIVLLPVFANQTARSVMDSTKIREAIGPSLSWYQETFRYELLFSNTPDGSLERRFPVLLIGLCLLTCMVVMLRKGKIPGAALGPSRRLIATTVLSFGVLALTPTKWTHHFGAFAALGGSLAALAGLATTGSVLSSRRNRLLFTAGLLVVTAIAFTGPNAWYDTANWGSPWSNMPPVLGGHVIGSLILALAFLTLIVAGIEHLRGPRPAPPVSQRRRLRFANAPLAFMCALMVLAQVANFGKVIIKQGPAYSLGKDNIAQLTNSSCGVSDYTMVETNPLADYLKPVGKPTMNGFVPGGFPGDTDINGAQRIWIPKFGTGHNEVPAWGDSNATGLSTMDSAWYPMPDRARDSNAIMVVDVYGTLGKGATLTAEFGNKSGQTFQPVTATAFKQPGDGNPPPDTPFWHELKLQIPANAAKTDAVRLRATDSVGGASNWLAFSAPRIPATQTMTKLVGNDPTFIEWILAQGYPCLRPFYTTDGISEMPKYWMADGENVADSSVLWSAANGGGPMAWLNAATKVRVLPTYLRDDLDRDTGTLYQLIPDQQDTLPASAAETVSHTTHWGWYTPGPVSQPTTATNVPAVDDGPGAAPNNP